MRVVVTRRLPAGGTDPLVHAPGVELVEPAGAEDRALTPDQLRDRVADADAVVCLLTDRISAAVLAAAPRLRVVANVAVGHDNVDVDEATARGVLVCNTPGVLDESTADLTWALILATARRLSQAEADLRAGRWSGWGADQYLGHDVHGATLGLVGYGRIARAVARRAEGFSMRVLHHSRTSTNEPGHVSLEELLAQSDVVSLHVPLTPATHHLIDGGALARMKPTAVLVNTARGPVVDEDALADALDSGALAGAGLDVHEHEPEVHPRLLASPRVTLLPHIGSATVATRTRMSRMACDAVRQVLLEGTMPPNAVNPEAWRTP